MQVTTHFNDSIFLFTHQLMDIFHDKTSLNIRVLYDCACSISGADWLFAFGPMTWPKNMAHIPPHEQSENSMTGRISFMNTQFFLKISFFKNYPV